MAPDFARLPTMAHCRHWLRTYVDEYHDEQAISEALHVETIEGIVNCLEEH